MYVSANGSAFFIGTARPLWEAGRVDAGHFVGEGWIEVGGLSSLGRTSGEWGTDTFPVLSEHDEEEAVFQSVIKRERPVRSMEIVVGLLPDDPGQAALLSAEDSVDAFGFQIVLPDGRRRLFIAVIVAMEDVIEDGQAALGLVFSLRLLSNIFRIEGQV